MGFRGQPSKILRYNHSQILISPMHPPPISSISSQVVRDAWDLASRPSPLPQACGCLQELQGNSEEQKGREALGCLGVYIGYCPLPVAVYIRGSYYGLYSHIIIIFQLLVRGGSTQGIHDYAGESQDIVIKQLEAGAPSMNLVLDQTVVLMHY